MKVYGDEAFMDIMRESQEESGNKDIRKGSVFVKEKELLFQERGIFRHKMWMWLPDDFALPDRELVKIKYPGENRPDVIYSNPESTVNVCFSHRQEKMSAGQESQVRDAIGQVICNLYPTAQISDQGSVQTGAGEEAAWMDFVTPAIDTQIYNLMFFTPLTGRLLMGSCNCLASDQDDWKGLFLQMIASIRSGMDSNRG